MEGVLSYKRNSPENKISLKTVFDHKGSLINKSDSQIWIAFKNGNKSAFIHIYNAYFDDLFTYAKQFTNDLELIKDAIQDVFIRLNESRERLSKTDCIKLYLYKSIKREIINALKQKCYSENQIEGMKGRSFEYEVSYEETMINRQIDDESLKRIRNATNSLNDRQREIIFYHFFEGFSIKQIKELMKFGSVQATYNLLNRALIHLRSNLD